MNHDLTELIRKNSSASRKIQWHVVPIKFTIGTPMRPRRVKTLTWLFTL